MRCISNGKIMQRAKDDEAQKRVEQGGWYIVTKNDYKRWLARQQQQPIGAPDFADIAGQDLHQAVSASRGACEGLCAGARVTQTVLM